jgi:hypothetical protein
MFDPLGVGLLTLAIAVFGWLVFRTWRARNRLLKWVGTSLAGLLTVVAVLLLGAALFGYWKLNCLYDNPVLQITVEMTSERIARGRC